MEHAVQHFDIAIIGAGLGGLACAAALAPLAEMGLKIALIAPNAPHYNDSRTTALTPYSQTLLQQWGVWSAMESTALPIEAITLTDSNRIDAVRLPTVQLTAEDAAHIPYFFLVENQALLTALRTQVDALPITRIEAQLTSHSTHAGAVQLTLDGAPSISASLVVAADGFGSPIRTREMMAVKRTDYNQSALTCVLSHAKPHNNTAVQHFFETGPLAFLPLAGTAQYPHRTSFVWSLPHDEATAFCVNTDALLTQLMRFQGGAYGQMQLCTPAVTFPLIAHVAQKFHAPRIALLGDAAHRIHPLAGQGLNMGLKDCDMLAQLLQKTPHALHDTTELGALLTNYTRTRQPEVTRLHGAQTLLNGLFANPSPTHRVFRHIGAHMFNAMPPLKKLAVQLGSGR